MKYKYIALNSEQKTLAGTIEAKNEQEARDRLNKLSLAVLSLSLINETADTETSGFDRYNFEARDKANKKVVGTISAENKLNALKRLKEEYELTVFSLYTNSDTPEEIAQSFNEIQKLNEQLINLKTAEIKKQENTEANSQISNEKLRQDLQKKAEEITSQINIFITKFEPELKPEELEYLKSSILHIQKIKNTENLENLERSLKEVLTYIQEKELFIESNKNIADQTKVQLETQQLLSSLKQLKLNQDITVLKSENSFFKQLKDAIFSSKPAISSLPPEIIQLENQLNQLHQEIWGYIRLIISTKKTQYRKQSLKALKIIIKKWWLLKKEIAIHKDYFFNRTEVIITSPFEKNLPALSTGLLSFYLGIYFCFYFLTSKNFRIEWPDFMYIHYTAILIYIIIGIFIAHLAILAKIWLNKHRIPGSNLSYAFGIFIFILISLNL
jgi:hypothetical protein